VISCDTVIKFIRSVPYQFLNILASSAIHATKPLRIIPPLPLFFVQNMGTIIFTNFPSPLSGPVL
jgi:hypothetical protein